MATVGLLPVEHPQVVSAYCSGEVARQMQAVEADERLRIEKDARMTEMKEVNARIAESEGEASRPQGQAQFSPEGRE